MLARFAYFFFFARFAGALGELAWPRQAALVE
jgi:hypothetical protein